MKLEVILMNVVFKIYNKIRQHLEDHFTSGQRMILQNHSKCLQDRFKKSIQDAHRPMDFHVAKDEKFIDNFSVFTL